MKHRYRCLSDLEDDMMLLCGNARRYNQETSQIYIDSLELEKGFLAARAMLDVTGESEEEGEGEVAGGGGVSVIQQPSQSVSSSVHVVEIESYASDNSDGEWVMVCNYTNTRQWVV